MGHKTKLLLLLACTATVAVAIAGAAPGCANSDGSPGELGGPPGDGGKRDGTFGEGGFGDGGDSGGGGGDSGGGGGDSGPTDTGCGEIGATNTCATVTDLGTMALGASKNVDGNLPVAGGDLWYKVTFDALADPAAHPRVTIKAGETGAAFLFEVVGDCVLENLGCGEEETSSKKVTDWEEKYAPDPAADSSAKPGDGGTFMPIKLGPGGSVYVRVFRADGPPTSCDGFTLTLSN